MFFNGGNVFNIILDKVEFVFEYCFLFGIDLVGVFDEVKCYVEQEVLLQMQIEGVQGCIEFEMLMVYLGMSMLFDDLLVSLVLCIFGSECVCKVGFGIEGGLFGQVGMLVVICGFGDIIYVYKFNEFVILE